MDDLKKLADSIRYAHALSLEGVDEVAREYMLAAAEALEKLAAQEPVAWLHTLHMEGGQTTRRVSLFISSPFGVRGQDFDPSYHVTGEPLYAAPQPAAQEPVAWRTFPDHIPPPDSECLVEVGFMAGTFRAVDRWEMQSECPVGWSSATIETGYDWSEYPGDVLRWIPISKLVAAPQTAAPVSMAEFEKALGDLILAVVSQTQSAAAVGMPAVLRIDQLRAEVIRLASADVVASVSREALSNALGYGQAQDAQWWMNRIVGALRALGIEVTP